MISWFELDNVWYMVALILGVSIHIRKSERKSNFILRLISSFLACIVLAYFLPTFAGTLYRLNYLKWVVLFFTVVIGSKACFHMEWFYIMNRCSFGWLTYGCAIVWGNLMKELFRADGVFQNLIEMICFVITYFIFYLLSFRENSPQVLHYNDRFKMIITNTLAIIGLSIVGNELEEQSEKAFIYLLYLIIIYLVLWLLSIFSEEKRLQDDYKIIRQILAKEEQQYEMSKEYIDLINLKCHDLKHQLYALRKGSIQSAELDEMETIVNNFDAEFDTGNEALDVVLTEKSRMCVQKNITFTCIADGEKMNFITPSNIYSMVGNILDNAIEGVETLDNIELRFISLKIVEESGVLHLHEENYLDKDIHIKEGLPITSKDDKLSHGFGVKSIQMIAEKYNGLAKFSTKENLFVVDIILPFTSK